MIEFIVCLAVLIEAQFTDVDVDLIVQSDSAELIIRTVGGRAGKASDRFSETGKAFVLQTVGSYSDCRLAEDKFALALPTLEHAEVKCSTPKGFFSFVIREDLLIRALDERELKYTAKSRVAYSFRFSRY